MSTIFLARPPDLSWKAFFHHAQVSLEILEPGGEISFFKKRRILTQDMQLLLTLHPAHIENLKELLKIRGHAHKQGSFLSCLNDVVMSEPLPELREFVGSVKASVFLRIPTFRIVLWIP